AKVLDFGMAKSLATPLATVDPVMTRRGRPLGTPYYMSPEQALGTGGVDHRSDLWAMGVIAFECLCGVRPFTGKSLVEVISQITGGPLPRPSEHAAVPTAFDAWFHRALQRDVQQRFQTAHALLHELRDALGIDALSATTHGPNSGASPHVRALGGHTVSCGFGDRTVKRNHHNKGYSFVGRQPELEAIDEARAAHCRVITIIGAPGSGRARLGLKYAASHSAALPGGVWSCSLDGVADDVGLWLRLGASLDARLSDDAPTASLGHALGGLGRGMLILQRTEGCRAALAAALSEWLNSAPDMLFMVTGNAPLRVATEWVLTLDGLPVPPAEVQGSLGVLRRYPAAELFMRRAVAVNRELLSQHHMAQSIADLTRITTGSPLALELLAQLCNRCDPATMARGVAQAVADQSDGKRPSPSTALAGTLRWIWEQLGDAEQALLAQLSCFAGSFDIHAAEAVVVLPLDIGEMVADGLETLCDGGFLLRLGPADDARYAMHPALRPHYMAQLRNSGEQRRSDTLTRHAAYFAQLGDPNMVEALTSYGGRRRRDRYVAEISNLDAAMHFARDHVSPEVAAAHARAVAALLRTYGLHGQAASTLSKATAYNNLDAQVRVELALARAATLLGVERTAAAVQLLQGIATDAAAPQRPAFTAKLRRLQTKAALDEAHYWTAATLAEQAMDEAHTQSRQLDLAHAQRLRAHSMTAIGNLAPARALLAAAGHTAAQLGALRLSGLCLADLGETELRMGLVEQARGHLEQALRHCYELGDRRDEARVLAKLARAYAGDTPRETARLLEQAVSRSRELGDVELERQLLMRLASRYEQAGLDGQARDTLRRAEHLLGRHEEADAVLVALLLRRGQIEVRQGDWQALDELLRSLQVLAVRTPSAFTTARRLAVDHLNEAHRAATRPSQP
ncbi:MAG TPA: hypothetical protein ENK23_01540, partial [Sorangium sp.]|nr:hypothetical protein [Sorangium sp.]